MNMDDFSKRLGLTRDQIQRVKTYWENAEQSEVKYCEEHDREFYAFEFQGICPVDYEEKLWYDFEHGYCKTRVYTLIGHLMANLARRCNFRLQTHFLDTFVESS